MSEADSFIDTSVLLYLLSGESPKADRVEELLAQRGAISVQVLNEFAAVATRKLALSLDEVSEVLETVRALCTTHPLTVESHDRGIQVAQRYKFSLYDSMIIASALLAGCRRLYAEDLQHGQMVDAQLTVINPFIAAGTRAKSSR
jgi:predicted nucleic acid-binding protein